MGPLIKIQNLTKYYGKHLGIENLNLQVEEGEVFGFLGPNGAGKSTTIKLLLNFIKPTSGSVAIFGQDPEKTSRTILKDVGYLPGEVHMYDQLSGRDHLKFQTSLRENVEWAFVEKLAERLDVALDKPIKSLSHGNKQKIALIGAFMHRPKLLILDEPTTGLDPLIQREFNDLVTEVNKKEGTTLFISSHVLPEVERICSRVGIIRKGNLVVTERIETLKNKAIRPIEIRFNESIKVGDFEKVPGIKNPTIKNNTLYCSVEGSLDKLIKQIAKYNVGNIFIQEPDLEQIFLSYYKGEKQNVA